MGCKCGGAAVLISHTVKELDKAMEWYEVVHEDELPITVNRNECMACGRIAMRPYTPSRCK